MRTTQALARHASVTTTERYCDLHLFDLRGTVGRLPLPLPAGAATPAMTESA
jgi:hypothetical protein